DSDSVVCMKSSSASNHSSIDLFDVVNTFSGSEEPCMRRRAFIAFLSGAAIAVSGATRAHQQSRKIWRMGFIAHGHEIFYDQLFESLREFGYVEGQNLVVERCYEIGRAQV